MYNVIFYGDKKEKTTTIEYVERVYTDDQGNYTDTIKTQEITKSYRVPEKFVFETATNCDGFFVMYDILDEFRADMRSLNSAASMFASSSITSFSGGTGGIADFKSLTNANDMFRKCGNLVSIKMDASSLQTVEGFVEGCTSLQSFKGSLSSLIDGSEMFKGLSEFVTFSADVTSLKDGSDMFNGTSLSSFTEDLPSLTSGIRMFYGTQLSNIKLEAPELKFGEDMFGNCSQLLDISFNTPSLTYADRMLQGTNVINVELVAPELQSAEGMFENVTTLSSFIGNLSGLENGSSMFKNTSLVNFDVESLNNLTIADEMMVGTQLVEWNIDLPNLKSAVGMFRAEYEEVEGEEVILDDIICPALTSFTGDLSNLQNGDEMFRDCVNLEHFDAPLSSLESGIDMFKNCKLDVQSVMYILGTLPVVPHEESRNITIGVNCDSSNIDSFIAEQGIYKDYNDMFLRTYYNGWNLTIVNNPS